MALTAVSLPSVFRCAVDAGKAIYDSLPADRKDPFRELCDVDRVKRELARLQGALRLPKHGTDRYLDRLDCSAPAREALALIPAAVALWPEWREEAYMGLGRGVYELWGALDGEERRRVQHLLPVIEVCWRYSMDSLRFKARSVRIPFDHFCEAIQEAGRSLRSGITKRTKDADSRPADAIAESTDGRRTDPALVHLDAWDLKEPGQASYRGKTFPLAGVKRRLLVRLVKARGRAASFNSLREAIGSDVENSTLTGQISRLRALLKKHLGMSSNPITYQDPSSFRLEVR